MKKITQVMSVLVIAILVIPPVAAQTEKSTWLLGGNMQIEHVSRDNGDTRNLYAQLNPRLGYFVFNKLVMGLGFPLEMQSTLNSPNRTVYFAVSPFTRFYAGSKSLKALFHVEMPYQILNTQVLEPEGLQPQVEAFFLERQGLGVGVGTGAAYFVSKSVAIEGLLFYQRNNFFPSNGNLFLGSSSRLGLTFGISIFMGPKNKENIKGAE